MEPIEERDSDVGIIFNEKYKMTINKFKIKNSHLIYTRVTWKNSFFGLTLFD